MALTYEAYTGFPIFNAANLDDIINYLTGKREQINDTSMKLKQYKQEVAENRENIDNPDEIIAYIDYVIVVMEKYYIEIGRLVEDLKSSVKKQHVISFGQLQEDIIYNDKSINKGFKEEHIARRLKDEEFRPLLDSIYADTGNMLYSLRSCGAIKKRLEALVGTRNVQYHQNDNYEAKTSEKDRASIKKIKNDDYSAFNKAVLELARKHEKAQTLSSAKFIAEKCKHLFPKPVGKDFQKGGVEIDALRKRVSKLLKENHIKINSKPGYDPEKIKTPDVED